MLAENDIDARGSFAVVERSMSDTLLELTLRLPRLLCPALFKTY